MDKLQKIDAVLVTTFKKWSSLIADPCIPADTSPSKGHLLVTGVSVSFAGDWLPRGRVTYTNVSINTLREKLTPIGITVPKSQLEQYWANYGNLFLHLYWKLYGRNAALAYHVLHGSDKGCQFHLDLTPSNASPSVTTGNPMKKVSLGALGKLLELTSDERKCFLEIVFKTQFAQSAASPEELQEIASELARQMRVPGGCLESYLEDRSLELHVKLQSSNSKAFTNALIDAFYLKKPNQTARRNAIKTVVQMLQLLYLYQPLAGNHAYLVCPEGSANNVRVCFLVWSNEAITDSCTFFDIMASDLSKKLERSLDVNIKALGNNIPSATAVLIRVVGSEIESLLTRLPTYAMPESYRPWLGHYLVLCDRLADVAVHEGKKLGFSFFVSSGEAASKEIEFVSSLSSESVPLRWQVNDELIPVTGCEEVISRLLGNYSFLQNKGSVIQVSWWGHLLALSRLLDDSKAPEELTHSLDDAYLIRIEENRDIKVFFKGALVLWRRGARWVVPRRYGDEYVTYLKAKIKEKFPDADNSVLHELCTNAWELSQHHERGGACFVLADLSSGDIDKGMMKMTDVFPFAEGRKLLTEASRKIFQDLAIQDGATLVDVMSGLVCGRRQIAVPMQLAAWERHLLNFKNKRGGNYWRDSHKTLRWGTRHLNALRAALHFKGKAVLITVSSDGDIHLFGKDGPVQDATYPGI
jgi:hypothetical protein